MKTSTGTHRYPGCVADDAGLGFFTSDCAYGCGAWMGSTRSGAPDGIDAFGACPNAPAAVKAIADAEVSGELRALKFRVVARGDHLDVTMFEAKLLDSGCPGTFANCGTLTMRAAEWVTLREVIMIGADGVNSYVVVEEAF